MVDFILYESLPFLNFEINEIKKKRFSPLVVTYVEHDVDDFFSSHGFTFSEIASAISLNLPKPFRIVPLQNLKQGNSDDCFQKILGDTLVFSQSFSFMIMKTSK